MFRIFVGKFSKNHPDQIKEKYYASSKEGNPWYGGIEPGDYVFPIHQGIIDRLWKVKEYTNIKNKVNPEDDGVVTFEEIKTFEKFNFSEFSRYKFFKHNLNMLNKCTKSVKNLGFINISLFDDCPIPENIDFKDKINIYISIESADIKYNIGDIRVLINNTNNAKITSIQRYNGTSFNIYNEMYELYTEKNEDNQYTLRELKSWSQKDNAPKKNKYLSNVIDEIEQNGFFKVSSPVSLYDNILVGRKRSYSAKNNKTNVNCEDIDEVDNLVFNEEYDKYVKLLNFNPNMILYGPPGTGKTYSIDKIIESFDNRKLKTNNRIDKIIKEGRAKYITFHQSYSYEEFIEGIRPNFSKGDNSNQDYIIENGIFKQIANAAESEFLKTETNSLDSQFGPNSKVWKVSLGQRFKDENIYERCIKNEEIAVGWLNEHKLDIEMDQDTIKKLCQEDLDDSSSNPINTAKAIIYFLSCMNVGDIVFIYDSPKTIRNIGIIQSDYEYYPDREDYRHVRKVKFLDLNYPIDIYEYNNQKRLTLLSVYLLDRINISDVVDIIKKNTKQDEAKLDIIKPYYLVIDEINRGNISKIFGELITLIEKDKRGNMKVKLPYSKSDFTVPDNLYVIGTMNTADRSIALLDTALRRRFTFVEIEPDPEVLIKENCNNINDTVDVAKILEKINKKITEKLDRDHRIGHAYFMDIDTLANLYNVWYYNIIPLLNEYFYNDFETVKEIIGNDFYDKSGNIKFLYLNFKQDKLSEFEKSLRKIYLQEV